MTATKKKDWSPQQESAIKSVRAWMQGKDKQVFRLFGYAGTGKTTLALEFANAARQNVLFGAFTGKAAHVLQKKGCFGASTIHSMIYVVDDEARANEPRFVINPNSPARTAGLIVIDECSMCGEDIGRDLLSFGKKVLVLGDPAQLPPVKGAGFFTNQTPDIMLTEVHRQARDNPIIRMSMDVREGRGLVYGEYGQSRVVRRDGIDAKQILATDQVLVGLNKTRVNYNARIRQLNGIEGPFPAPGEKLVCLQNDREKKLLNGSLWIVKAVVVGMRKTINMVIVPEDKPDAKRGTEVEVRKEFFLGTDGPLTYDDTRGQQRFTYGYALTVHKAQGSQWNDVVVFDESMAFRQEKDKHLYTSITRAAERITVVR